MQMVNEKVKKRLELVTPPKKPQAEKPLDTPTEKKKSLPEQKSSNPLKEVKNFNEIFLQDSDKLRAKAEITEEVQNTAKEEAKSKPLIKERKMQIKTVAQVHQNGNELENREEGIEKELDKEHVREKEDFQKKIRKDFKSKEAFQNNGNRLDDSRKVRFSELVFYISLENSKSAFVIEGN